MVAVSLKKFFFQAEDGIRDHCVTGVQTCALPIYVLDAVKRSKDIMNQNLKKGYILQEYRGFTYYRENPSLSVWEVVEKILLDCNLLA